MRALFAVVFLFLQSVCSADEITPYWNLAGVEQLNEKFYVNLNVKGADEFNLSTDEIIKIFKDDLSATGITYASQVSLPTLYIQVNGESSGGGGARCDITAYLSSNIPSLYANGKSIKVVIWIRSEAGEDTMRYDTELKKMIKPTGKINDRVYLLARKLSSALSYEIKKANEEAQH